MKTLSLCLSLFIASLSTTAETKGKNSTPSTPPQDMLAKMQMQMHTGKILKVFAAKEKDATFIAYLLKHKKREIIVTDMFSVKPKKVGETINYMSQPIDLPSMTGIKKKGRKVLQFSIVPQIDLNDFVNKPKK